MTKKRERWTTRGVGGVRPKEVEDALRRIYWDDKAPGEARGLALGLLNGDVEAYSKEHGADIATAAAVAIALIQQQYVAVPRKRIPTRSDAMELSRWIPKPNPRIRRKKKLEGGPLTPELEVVRVSTGKRIHTPSALHLAREFRYLRALPHEEVWIGLLDAKMRLFGRYMVSKGGPSSSAVYVSELMRAALLANARNIMLVHNHPSGDPNPSNADIAITKRVVDAGEILDVPLVDHIVIAADYFPPAGLSRPGFFESSGKGNAELALYQGAASPSGTGITPDLVREDERAGNVRFYFFSMRGSNITGLWRR